MSSRLLPCPGCERHVRAAESHCPFCSEPLAYQSVGPAAVPGRRLGRAAKFAFGAAVAGVVAVSGCGDDSAPTDAGTGTDTGAADTGTSSDSAVDTGGIMPAYGAPADAGTDSATADSGLADGSSGALYGAPPEG